MKKIWLVRHAKSSWDFPELPDFERPLNARGRKEAPAMARWAAQQGLTPDALLYSPAARAKHTAQFFFSEWPAAVFQEAPTLYEADVPRIWAVIRQCPENWSSLMVFGHNPGFHLLVSQLYSNHLENLPTCAVAGVVSSANTWQEVTSSNSICTSVWSPKAVL